MKREHTDLLIIGSGFGGAVAARRLSGLGRVLLLEKGGHWHPDDFRQNGDPRYMADLFDLHTGTGVGILSGSGLGGSSLVYSQVSVRTPSEAFELRDQEGIRLWPEEYNRAALDPYYERVEKMLGVTQMRWDLPEDPKDRWKLVSPRDRVFARGLSRLGYTCDALPLALTDCTDCGWCSLGCRHGAKNSLDHNYLPEAAEQGVEIRVRSRATAIRQERDHYVVRVANLKTGESHLVQTRRLILAAGAIGTAKLLLRARRAGTLTRLSPHIGHHLSLNGDLGLGAIVPDHPTQSYRGKIDGSITYQFWNEGFTIQCVRFPALVPALGLPSPYAARLGPLIGLEYKRRLPSLVHNHLPLGVLGLDDSEGSVRLGAGGISYVTYRPNQRTRAMWNRSIRAAREIAEDGLGGRLLSTPLESRSPIGTVHPLGTCRMADDPSRGVVQPWGEVHGHPGLYCLDGSALPASLGVNTSLTVAAVVERACEQILAEA